MRPRLPHPTPTAAPRPRGALPAPRRAAALLTAALVGCGGAPPPDAGTAREPAPSPWGDEARRGVADPGLAAVLDDHWEWSMREWPLWATRLGDRRHDDRLADRSPEGFARRAAARRRFRDALLALGSGRGDLGADAETHRLLLGELEAEVAAEVCRFETWNVSARGNAVSRANRLPELHAIPTPADGANLLARYRAVPGDVDVEIANLRRGLADGRTATRETLRRLHAMVAAQRDEPLEDWALLDPADAPLDGWPDGDRRGFREDLRRVVDGEIRPAIARYAAFLRDTLLPAARSDERPGLASLPGGDACYAAMRRVHLAIESTPEALHALGQRELAKTDAAMAELGARLFGAPDLPATLARLRSDPALHFDDADAIEAKATEALARARAAIPGLFGTLPRADCVVSRVPAFEAPFTTIAYYRPPTPDGSNPGQYFVNVHAPETRPRYGMEALTFHESIPGHHLQIALAQERDDLPLFRRHGGATTLVEGWALYAERLADELGLYSGDLDRLGMYSYRAWRAARLVVDTGIHAMGWDRERAVRTMLQHTALAEANVRNEVDRYVATPGQALAYMVGALEIASLRREAEAALGDGFALPEFHDVVLGAGAVTLPVLQGRVRRWIAGQSPPGPDDGAGGGASPRASSAGASGGGGGIVGVP